MPSAETTHNAALEAARSEPEILAALAAGAWVKERRPGKPSIPTPADLATWWTEAPDGELQEPAREADDRLADLAWPAEWGELDGINLALWPAGPAHSGQEPHPGEKPPPARLAAYLAHSAAPAPGEIRREPGGAVRVDRRPVWRVVHLEDVHRAWIETPGKKPKPHPWAPLVRAWWDRATAVEPFHPVRRASLPRLVNLTEEDARLPTLGSIPDPPPQFTLFDLSPAVQECPSWLLWLFDQAGGQSMTAGRGAPWSLHLFVSVMLHLPVEKRTGAFHTLRFPLRKTEINGKVVLGVEDWLHPNGWDASNRRRDWHRLPEALEEIKARLSYVPIEGVGSVMMLAPSVIPHRPTDPGVEFVVRCPPAAAAGDRADWVTLCRYRLQSAALYRAYLSVVTHLGKTARSGQPITREIPAPVLGPDGEPIRGKGGRIRRSRTERIPNPQARFQRLLNASDFTRMIGLDPAVRPYRQRAVAAFERMHRDGIIELVEEPGKTRTWRVFGPPPG